MLRTIELCFISLFILSGVSCVLAQGRSPVHCKSVERTGDFKILHTNKFDNDPYYVFLAVPPKKQTEENLIAASNYFKNLYCKQDQIYVAFFDSKKHYQLYLDEILTPTPRSAPTVLYVLDRLKHRELLEITEKKNGKINNRTVYIQKPVGATSETTSDSN